MEVVSTPPFEVLDDDCLGEEVWNVESEGTNEELDVYVTIIVEGDSLLFGSVSVTMDEDNICWGVEAAGEGTEETEDVVGDGFNDEIDGTWTCVDEEIAIDVDGGALEEGVSVGKVNGVEIAVDVVKGIETDTC